MIPFIAAGCGSKFEAPVVASAIAEQSPVEAKTKGDHVPGDEIEADCEPGLKHEGRPPLRAPAVAIDDPELQPLVSYIKAEFAKPIKDDRRPIIDPH